MKAKYLHASMMGSYYIPCEIKGEGEEQYFISYFDPLSEEDINKWVDKDLVEGNGYVDVYQIYYPTLMSSVFSDNSEWVIETINECEYGEVIEVSRFKMTEEEYNSLGEFTGF